MKKTAPEAFDEVAGEYDSSFTQSALGRQLRTRVWWVLGRHFLPGQDILELACGTGEDAIWLAQRGVWVTATDGSAEMIRIAKRKAEIKGLSPEEIHFHQISLQEIMAGQFSNPLHPDGQGLFDGIFSNFGGLNTIPDWHSLAETLAGKIRPGGRIVLVPMGPVCPWEMAWYLFHARPGLAFRRLNGRSQASVGGEKISVWYPSAGKLRKTFSPWFDHLSTESLGLWLPPSYLDHLFERWPELFNTISRWESETARVTKGLGDHYIMVLERSPEGSRR